MKNLVPFILIISLFACAGETESNVNENTIPADLIPSDTVSMIIEVSEGDSFLIYKDSNMIAEFKLVSVDTLRTNELLEEKIVLRDVEGNNMAFTHKYSVVNIGDNVDKLIIEQEEVIKVIGLQTKWSVKSEKTVYINLIYSRNDSYNIEIMNRN